ncbi:MAG: hypothetical protein ACXVBT_01055 [Flavisolibacter sp.]
MSASEENNFFQKKHTTSVAFLVGLLLFFLPFVQVKCNNMPFAQNTGLGLAFGMDYKVTGQARTLQDQVGGEKEGNTSKEKGKMDVLALAALVLGLTGLFVSLSNQPIRSTLSLVLGPLAALCLVIVMIQIRQEVKSQVSTPEDGNGVSHSLKVTADFTLWYYLSVCSFLGAGFLGYRQGSSKRVLPPVPETENPLRRE